MRNALRKCPRCRKKRRFSHGAEVCVACEAKTAAPTRFNRREDPALAAELDLGRCRATEPDAGRAEAKEIRDEQIAACRRVAIYELLRDFHDCRSVGTARLLWDLLKTIGIVEPYPQPQQQCPACMRVGAYVDQRCRACGWTREAIGDYQRKLDGTGLCVKENIKRLAKIAPLDLHFNR